jgi:hypothetical protein
MAKTNARMGDVMKIPVSDGIKYCPVDGNQAVEYAVHPSGAKVPLCKRCADEFWELQEYLREAPKD